MFNIVTILDLLVLIFFGIRPIMLTIPTIQEIQVQDVCVRHSIRIYTRQIRSVVVARES